jgi:DNA-binding beta-propeller fold protein YncE
MNLIRAVALVALALGACNLSNPGFDVPVGVLAYPIAITLSEPSADVRAGYLYVANSNFDLRFNGGSVQSYDLDALEKKLYAEGCVAVDEDGEGEPPVVDAGRDAQVDAETEAGLDADAGDADLDAGPLDPDAELGDAEALEGGVADAAVDAAIPGITIDAGVARDDSHTAKPKLCDGSSGSDPSKACCFTENEALNEIRASETSIDSFASAITTSPDGAHVYVPVRSQSRLLYLDVADGQLSCGSETGRCRRGPKIGHEAEIDDLEYPALPSTVLTGSFADLNVSSRPERDFVATAHERGEVSLFALDRKSGSPNLLYTLAGCQMSTVCASQPRAASLRLDRGFMLVSATQGADIARIAARTDVTANDDREPPGVYLYQTAPIAISGLVFNIDIRDVQPDAREQAAGVSNRYYALLRGNSGPIIQSVAFLELDASTPDGRFARAIDAVRVGVGMIKLVQADVGGRHLLFVSCYQDGEIHVIDADQRTTVTVIRDVLGPSDMQVDVARKLLYVTDFRASVLRVIDLHSLAHGGDGVPRVVATVGAPYLPGNVK